MFLRARLKFKQLVSIVMLLALLLVGLEQAQAETEVTKASARVPAPEFELNDLKDEAIRLSQFKGKVVVINFWATWCAPCKQEIPHLSRILENNQDQGLVILTISTDSPQTQSQVGRLARRWKTQTLLDPEGRVVAQLNPRGIQPYTVIVDRQGRIAYEHDGYTVGEEVEMEKAIKQVLAEDSAKGEVKAEETKAVEIKEDTKQ